MKDAQLLNELLSDLRAAVWVAATMLERDERPVREEAAKKLRNAFVALSSKIRLCGEKR